MGSRVGAMVNSSKEVAQQQKEEASVEATRGSTPLEPRIIRE